MTTYLYCLLAPAQPELLPAGLTGLAGAPVRALAIGGIEAWVGTMRGAVAADVGNARLHNEVVEAAMATGRTPLPARFGQRFADDPACLADIDRRRAALDVALHRVAGGVEMGVLITAAAPPSPAPAKATAVDPGSPRAGHRYLNELRFRAAEEERWRERVLDQAAAVEREVASLVRASAPPEVGRARVAGKLSHLIATSDVAAYRAAAGRAVVAPGFHIVLAGPRAPYSFCDVPGTEAGMILAT